MVFEFFGKKLPSIRLFAQALLVGKIEIDDRSLTDQLNETTQPIFAPLLLALCRHGLEKLLWTLRELENVKYLSSRFHFGPRSNHL